MKFPSVLLPKNWTKRHKQALQTAVALERTLVLEVCADLDNSLDPRARLAADNARLRALNDALREEIRIKEARLAAIPARRRPYYPPAERLAILVLRAKMGWTLAETARRFVVTRATIARWMRRLDDDGPDALVQTRQPVNRFPDFVAVAERELRVATGAGKRRAAALLARLGVSLSASTVGRLRKRPAANQPHAPQPSSATSSGNADTETGHAEESTANRSADKPARYVTANRPHHLWHIDLTLLPAGGCNRGFWLPWWPFALPVVFPACFWLCAILDHFTRAVVAWRLFAKEPTAEQVCALLDDTCAAVGRAPKYTVTDQGVQFRSEFRDWCDEHDVVPRFGALYRHGSIAIIERFFHSLKAEMLCRLPLVPLSFDSLLAEVLAYVHWYNVHRAHQSLGGRTPAEVRDGVVRKVERLEPRARYPIRDGTRRVDELELRIAHVEGRKHLPIVSLRKAA